TAVATRLGTVEVAAHDVAFELWSFLALALDSLAIAAQALVAHRLGAYDAAGARSASARILQWGFTLGLVFGVVVLAARPWLPDLFTADRRVADLAAFVLVYVAVIEPVNGVVFALDGILIGAGDLRFLAWAMGGASLVFIAGAV